MVIEFARTVEAAGNVELPQFQRCLVAHCEHSLEARGERTQPQLSVIGGPRIGIAEGSGGCETAEERVGGVYLRRVGTAPSGQVGKGESVRSFSSVRIDDRLVEEIGVVVVQVDFEILAGDRNAEGGGDACVPCLFLSQPFPGDEGLAARQD